MPSKVISGLAIVKLAALVNVVVGAVTENVDA
jgi:hypothetical protein